MNDHYLAARVTTASQPELHLLLLDGALRFGRLASQGWEQAENSLEVDNLLTRLLDVTEELVRSVTASKLPESDRLEEEYAFAFRSLAAARINRDRTALDAAMKILEFHRETWRQACEKLRLGGAAPGQGAGDVAPDERASESAPPAASPASFLRNLRSNRHTSTDALPTASTLSLQG